VVSPMLRPAAWCLATVFLVAVCSALPVSQTGGEATELGADPSGGGQVPIRGVEENDANKAAEKVVKNAQRQQEEAQAKRDAEARALSRKENKLSTQDLDNELEGMDKGKRPIDVMSQKYKSLAYKPSSTPKSVLAAEAYANKVSSSEKKMKDKSLKKSRTFERYTHMKVPTLAGMKLAIKSTIDANMKQSLGALPFKGSEAWESVLPTKQTIKKWENDAAHSVPVTAQQPEAVAAKAEEQMLTQRQKAIARQEQKLAEEKVVEQKKMVKVASSENAFESKVMSRAQSVQLAAQKRMHTAMFALKQAAKDEAEIRHDKAEESTKVKRLKTALKDSILQNMAMGKVAKSKIALVRHHASRAEHTEIKRLKKLAQTRIQAMATTAQQIAKKEIAGKEQLKADKSKIRYLSSKVKLQRRQDRRDRSKLRKSIEKKKSIYWRGEIKAVRHRLQMQNKNVGLRLQAAQKEEAEIAKRALKSQNMIQKLKMPLEAKTLADKLRGRDAKQVKKLTTQNAKLQTALEALKDKLKASQRSSISQSMVLAGKKRANKKLVKLIKDVNHDRETAEKAAAETDFKNHELVTKIKKDKEKMVDSAKSPRQALHELMSTPCHGDSCKSLDSPEFSVGPNR